jgi:hypothetical protein
MYIHTCHTAPSPKAPHASVRRSKRSINSARKRITNRTLRHNNEFAGIGGFVSFDAIRSICKKIPLPKHVHRDNDVQIVAS